MEAPDTVENPAQNEELTSGYLRQFDAAWDDPDQAATEMENGG